MKEPVYKKDEHLMDNLREELKTANAHIRTLNNKSFKTAKTKKAIGYWEGYVDAIERSLRHYSNAIWLMNAEEDMTES